MPGCFASGLSTRIKNGKISVQARGIDAGARLRNLGVVAAAGYTMHCAVGHCASPLHSLAYSVKRKRVIGNFTVKGFMLLLFVRDAVLLISQSRLSVV